MCHPPTCVYRVYIAACCVVCLIGAVAVIAIGMALGYRMGEDSVYNFKENRPNGVVVSSTNREQMAEVQSHFKHITTSLTGSGIVSGTISMIGGYGACCNLSLALYLFMVGVAMLVVAEVATGAIVYYKQTLIMEILSQFRQSGICGTICFLDDLVSRQLMSAVVIVIGMTVLQIGQIICAYCIVRRLSTPKPVRNIQHAVRRMTAHIFNIHSTAVTGGGPTSSPPSSAAASPPSHAPAGDHIPVVVDETLLVPNVNFNLPVLSVQSFAHSDQQQHQPISDEMIEGPSLIKKTAILVSEGAQTDELEELTRPLLSSHRPQEEEEEESGDILTQHQVPVDVVTEVVELVEETSTGPQKSCLRYSVSSRPAPSVSDASKGAATAVHPEDTLKDRTRHQSSNNHINGGKQQTIFSDGMPPAAADLITPAQAAGYQQDILPVTSDCNTTDAEPPRSEPQQAVVVLQCLSPKSHQQRVAGGPSGLLKSEQTAAAASSSLTHHLSMAARAGRVTKLIPSSGQSSLPVPHFVRKLNDFRDIQQSPITPAGMDSFSPITRKHVLASTPAAAIVASIQQQSIVRQHKQQQETGGDSMQPNNPSNPTQRNVNVSENFNDRTSAAQILRFAALPQSIVIPGSTNMSNNRRARSYTNVGGTDEEAFEAADYIDLRELRRSPGTPGRTNARFGHIYNRSNVLCTNPLQQQPVFPRPNVSNYSDNRGQWPLPEIRTLYVSYV